MKRIAIIGAGFAGLSLAWHLLSDPSHPHVTLFDAKGFGGGASGIAPGLLHPYVGEQCRRNFMATEGLAATNALLEIAQGHVDAPVILSEGVLRSPQDPFQEESLSSYPDVVLIAPGKYLITTGKTVNCKAYLQGLMNAVSSLGGRLVQKEISDLSSLSEFDQVVSAAGAGVRYFFETLPIGYSKGQILMCKPPRPVEMSAIGKGYVTMTADPQVCCVGSTYEKNDLTDTIDTTSVQNELFPKIEKFYPDVNLLQVLQGKTAIRVVRRGHYLPLVGNIKPGVWIFTALGSRGLLYHGLVGKFLKNALVTSDESEIPEEFRLRRKS